MCAARARVCIENLVRARGLVKRYGGARAGGFHGAAAPADWLMACLVAGAVAPAQRGAQGVPIRDTIGDPNDAVPPVSVDITRSHRVGRPKLGDRIVVWEWFLPNQCTIPCTLRWRTFRS